MNDPKTKKTKRKDGSSRYPYPKEAWKEEQTLDQTFEAPQGVIAGRNAVMELLQTEQTVDKLFVKRGEREGSIRVIVSLAIQKKIPVIECENSKLDALCGGVKHQGVVAMAAEIEYKSVEDLFEIAAQRGEDPFFVLADGITDPHNLGAMIRCAEGAGAHGIIISKRRTVGTTAVVAKASAGALNHLAVAKVSNLHTTVLELKKRGVWVYAAEAGGTRYDTCDFRGPCAFIFGSEGEGVSRLLKETADGIVSLPMRGKVNSLNVSTATAVILYEAAKQRDAKA